MNLTERFSTVLSSIEFQLARSLPVLDKEKEIIFFYKTEEINSTEYRISDIRYVVIRDIKSGRIEKKNATEIIPDTILNSVIGSINTHIMSVEQELETEDKYYEYYEKLYVKALLQSIPNDVEVDNLSILFTKLVEGTKLIEIYRYLGEKFIKMIFRTK